MFRIFKLKGFVILGQKHSFKQTLERKNKQTENNIIQLI